MTGGDAVARTRKKMLHRREEGPWEVVRGNDELSLGQVNIKEDLSR